MTPATPAEAPASPPKSPSAVDSARNCAAMCRGLAPSARRRPISLARSSTATRVVLPIPTAPMTRAIPASARNTAFRLAVTECLGCSEPGADQHLSGVTRRRRAPQPQSRALGYHDAQVELGQPRVAGEDADH